MSDRNRGFFIEADLIAFALLAATAIAIFTWPITSNLADYGEANPRSRIYTAGGSECQPAALAAISDERERIRRAEYCATEAEDYRQKTADLIQQTRAADAAQAQANIAGQQLWSGWLQTIGGFLTLCAVVAAAIYARDAANEGKRSADLAGEELTETRKVTASQLRPYVAFTDAGPEESAPFNRQSKLKIRIQNFGQVPAQNVRLAVSEMLVTEPVGDTEFARGPNVGSYGFLAPGDGRSDTINTRNFSLEDLAIIGAGDATLTLRLRLDYDWPSGSDFHEIVMILDQPETNSWSLLDERRRREGPM